MIMVVHQVVGENGGIEALGCLRGHGQQGMAMLDLRGWLRAGRHVR